MFYPFFRAHCSIDNTYREPWLQTEAVQTVIREAVFNRYHLIYYLYTAFEQAATLGVPIMRPMFVEFPEETEMFNTASQFMWGDNILVSPKLSSPGTSSDEIWQVSTVLPTSVTWYNLITKLVETETQIDKNYTNDQIPCWVKAGSIIPILNHQRELSLLRALVNPLSLQIYLNPASMDATGRLFLDDGQSTSPLKSSFTFTFDEQGNLTFTADKGSDYHPSSSIDLITIYGVKSEPTSVTDANGTSLASTFDSTHSRLQVPNLNVPLDQLTSQV